MTTSDQQNHRYVLAEKELFQALYGREKWYVGELLGYDPESTEYGKAQIAERMYERILDGFGRWAAEQVNKTMPE